jgi:hypothetical protein
MTYPSYSGNSYNGTPQYPTEEQQSYPQSSQYIIGDEGEASGGEYDDTYAPTNPSLISYGPAQFHGSGDGGYIGNAQRTAAYPRAQNQSPLQLAPASKCSTLFRSIIAHTYPLIGNDYYPREDTQVVPQYSDSFSSHYSAGPKPADLSDPSRARHNYNNSGPSYTPEQHVKTTALNHNQSSWNQNMSVHSSEPRTNQNRNHVPESEDILHQPLSLPTTRTAALDTLTTKTSTPPAPAQPTLSQEAGMKIPKSVAEARKEAQGAVLNLYPFQIGFQTFMDEGFDERIVGAVFDDLGLTRSSAKTFNTMRSSSNLPTTTQALAKTIPAQRDGYSTAPTFTAGQVDVPFRTDENTNPPKAPSIDKPSILSSTAATNAVPLTKPSAMTEKERKLQMKMEALRKSREQRAQKAAAKNDTTIVNSAVPVPITESKLATWTANSKSKLDQLVSINTTTVSLPRPALAERDNQAPMRPNSSILVLQPASAHHVPTIPGLFLAPSTDGSAPSPNLSGATNAPVNTSQRKRPVAADFDTPTGTPTPKRPFGQSRYERPVVINVTDEEQDSDDEDVAMELESSADHNSPVLAARKMSDQRNTITQNLTMLTTLPNRKPFTPPPVSSASSTPTARKSTLGNPEVLQEKEIAIEALRKKIAEAEAAKALKKAKKAANGTGTPRTTDSSGDDSKAMDSDIAKKIESSIQIQQKINSAEAKVSLDQKRLAEARAIEVKNIAELERSEADQNRLRRERIATELPRVDAEVQRNQLKLELLRSEMARIEAAVRQSLEEKKRMADEMERLGQDAEDRVQAEKDKLQSLTNAGATSASGKMSSPSYSHLYSNVSVKPLFIRSGCLHYIIDSPGQTQVLTPMRDIVQIPLPVSDQSQPSEPTSSEDSRSAALVDVKLPDLPNTVITIRNLGTALDTSRPEIVPVNNPPATSNISMENAGDPHAPETVTRGAERATTKSISQGKGDDKIVEESTAVDSSQSALESISNPMEIASRSPSYSPVLERTIAAVSEREDDYEPPDATLPTTALSTSGSPPFSPAPPESISRDDLRHDTIALTPTANENMAEVALIKRNGPAIPPTNEVQLFLLTHIAFIY